MVVQIKNLESDFLEELSTENQQLISGGHWGGGWGRPWSGGGHWGGGWGRPWSGGGHWGHRRRW